MKNWTIGKKLTVCTGALCALTIVVSYVCITSARSSHEMFEVVTKQAARKVELAGMLNTYAVDLHRSQRGMIMYGFLKRDEGADMCRRDFQKSLGQMRNALGEFRATASAETQVKLGQIQSVIDAWLPKYEEISQACARHAPEAAIDTTISTLPLVKQVESVTNGLIQQEQNVMAEFNRQASDQYSFSLTLSLILLALSAGIGGLALWVVRNTSLSLRQMAEEIEQGAVQVAGAAGHVASSSQSLAQGASEQAASLEQTSASTEEINAMAQRNTENSRTAADVVTRSGEKFTEVSAVLTETVTAMGEISASSDKIAKIIKVIDEIAFQTNILALNAAVEAARAGSAGLGFAVVADEVRNLAQRSAQAAKDTSALIADSIAKSRDGKTKVDQVAEAIRTVVADAGDIKELVEEVNTGSTEQAAGIQQIAKAITQMEQVTQKNAASAEQSASAAEQLSAQAAIVRDVVSRLNTMVVSKSNAPARPARVTRPAKAAARPLRAASLKPAAAAGPTSSIPLDDDFPDFPNF